MAELLITTRAQQELDRAYDWWVDHRSAAQANLWYGGFIEALLKLETDSEQHPLAAESGLFPYKVRQLNYGLSGKPTHRALYTIRGEQVVILRVRHVAQQPLSSDDV
jgi:plasmid stabilization system protein ParE